MDMEEKAFEIITETCMNSFESETYKNPVDLALDIMRHPEFPMHNYAHHYLVPAVLLTALRKKRSAEDILFEEELEKAKKRAKEVRPAFCGTHGACGAAIGTGIFFSIMTRTTPLSKETWSLCNRVTADSLKEMAEVGGPRCCKRNTFIAINYAAKVLLEEFMCGLSCPQKTECSFSEYNLECLKEDCPFYKKDSADK